VKQINSLKDLLSELDNCSDEDYVSLGRNLNIPSKDLLPFAFWSGLSYTRNCIERTDEYELLLLCWEEGQSTAIHSHNEQECWVYTIEGSFEEERYTMDEERVVPLLTRHVVQTTGKRSYMNDEMGYHSLKNISDGRAMSLHLYVKPIDQCLVYDEESQQFTMKELYYNSHQGVLLQMDMVENYSSSSMDS
jgi:cysteine dioxygenase